METYVDLSRNMMLILYLGISVLIPEACSRHITYMNPVEDPRHEYCINTDGFRAQCLKNEVIVMLRAEYGRMKIGKCLQDEGLELLSALGNDPLFLGCSADILSVMDRKCSGKNHCEIRGMMDSDFRTIKPCHAALQLYMEASYYCANVVQEDRSCKVSLSHGSQEHILSGVNTSASKCGTAGQPWVVEASTGQQIKINLLLFNMGSIPATSACKSYGYITEGATIIDISCNSDRTRESLMYISKESHLKIVIFPEDKSISDDSRILLKLEATGCPNIVPPLDAWLRRSSHEAVIGCYTSRQTWHLRCVNNQWIGVYGNCTLDIGNAEVEVVAAIQHQGNSNEVIVIVCIASVGLIVCVSIISVGAVCLKKYYAMIAQKSHFYYAETDALNKGSKKVDKDGNFAIQSLHA